MPLQHVVARLSTRQGSVPVSRSLTIAAAMAALTSCMSQAVPSQADRETALADEIESKVVMPEGAAPLQEYARVYAKRPDGRIAGSYVLNPEPGGNKPGTRNWVSLQELPILLDGGCAIVNIVFDLETRTVEEASCNGLA